jgi:hypothetical protein
VPPLEPPSSSSRFFGGMAISSCRSISIDTS